MLTTTLLATTLHAPPLPYPLVRRARLVETIERAIPHTRLVVVSAPAGYGKTTLLAEWADTSRFPVAWLSLDAEDYDLERLLRALLAAWAEVDPAIANAPVGLLLSAADPDGDAVLRAFINEGMALSDQLVIVLDDYHLIEDAAIHQALTFLTDHLPPRLHLLLAGRSDPPLPLARYRARRELLEIGTEALAFEVGETDTFLRQVANLELAPDDLNALHTRLEGWVAGLQLASLSLRHHGQATPEQAVSGRQRFIGDYLRDEVLAHLPDDVRLFLLETSLLERLSAGLCAAVTGRDDSQARLEALERAHLFLLPVDDRREWYRYHPLFADVLQAELVRQRPEEVAGLHRRAARWHLAHDLPEPAFRHAVTGDDLATVVEIAERYFVLKLLGGELRVAQRWVEAIPASWYVASPELGICPAAVLMVSGAFEACIQRLDTVEHQLAQARGRDTRRHIARSIALRCFMACFQNDLDRAEGYAYQALRDLSPEDHSFRSGIYGALGDTYRRNGRWDEARNAYLKILDINVAITSHPEAAHLLGALADLALRRGQLRDAGHYWRQALVAVNERENWGRIPLPVSGWVYVRLGEYLYERNTLAEAWEHLTRGMERAELGGDVPSLIAGYLLAGRLKLTAGESAAAADYLKQAEPLVRQAPPDDWIGRLERLQLELWLAQRQLPAAAQWVERLLREDVLDAQPDRAVTQLAIARALIAHGDIDSRWRAVEVLVEVLATAETEGRLAIEIEGLTLLALARWGDGDRAAALTALERALRLAEPEGYVRLFADLGLPLARLLQEARGRGVMPEYVETLLTAFTSALPVTATELALPEPLTEREHEILRLIAAGLTNREIAERLFISAETVKKHTGNIYGKLSVRGRTAAVARARSLHLLD